MVSQSFGVEKHRQFLHLDISLGFVNQRISTIFKFEKV